MRVTYAATLLAIAGGSLLCAASAIAASDPKAVEVAERSMAAMGGKERFAAARLLRFDFAPVRDGKVTSSYHHWWDRQTGAYRVEGVSKEGVPYRILFDVGTKQGKAWLGDRELAGDELAQWLERGYGRFINDTYWLLMPWKWLDPGVNLEYVGKKTVDGQEYEVVTLSFGSGVGLTSNDHYWAYVSTKSNLMERWEYVLETEEGAPGNSVVRPGSDRALREREADGSGGGLPRARGAVPGDVRLPGGPGAHRGPSGAGRARGHAGGATALRRVPGGARPGPRRHRARGSGHAHQGSRSGGRDGCGLRAVRVEARRRRHAARGLRGGRPHRSLPGAPAVRVVAGAGAAAAPHRTLDGLRQDQAFSSASAGAASSEGGTYRGGG